MIVDLFGEIVIDIIVLYFLSSQAQVSFGFTHNVKIGLFMVQFYLQRIEHICSSQTL